MSIIIIFFTYKIFFFMKTKILMLKKKKLSRLQKPTKNNKSLIF